MSQKAHSATFKAIKNIEDFPKKHKMKHNETRLLLRNFTLLILLNSFVFQGILKNNPDLIFSQE